MGRTEWGTNLVAASSDRAPGARTATGNTLGFTFGRRLGMAPQNAWC
jgi:hypothetical protein